ncbi:MAG: tRNA pseudouridine(38-40) synthase TruA [Bacillota bacterium]
MAAPDMRGIGLVVQYQGGGFHGFQVQGKLRTVQLVLEEAVFKLTGIWSRVRGAGRTDAGVHALGQVAYFETSATIPLSKWVPALNAVLPRDVAVIRAFEPPKGFHPRYWAKAKTYAYAIFSSQVRSPFLEGRAYHFCGELDPVVLDLEAKDMVGQHDFRAFCATGSSVRSTVRQVYKAGVQAFHIGSGKLLLIYVEANGFLYNMVRILAGTLLDVGRGRLPRGTIRHCLETRRREDAGATLPGEGLWLVGIKYDFLDTTNSLNYNEICRLITGGQEVCG